MYKFLLISAAIVLIDLSDQSILRGKIPDENCGDHATCAETTDPTTSRKLRDGWQSGQWGPNDKDEPQKPRPSGGGGGSGFGDAFGNAIAPNPFSQLIAPTAPGGGDGGLVVASAECCCPGDCGGCGGGGCDCGGGGCDCGGCRRKSK